MKIDNNLKDDIINFKFLEPGKLIDNDLELILTEKIRSDSDFNISPMYNFTMFKTGTEINMGRIGLRVILTENLKKFGGNIDYEVNEEFRGNKYAARSCRLIFPLIQKHGLEQILITCDPKNTASVRTCEILGARLKDIINIEIEPNKFRDTCRYIINL